MLSEGRFYNYMETNYAIVLISIAEDHRRFILSDVKTIAELFELQIVIFIMVDYRLYFSYLLHENEIFQNDINNEVNDDILIF